MTSSVLHGSRGERLLRGSRLYVAAFIAALALLLVPAAANAAEPVLEAVAPGSSLPVSFTTESGSVTAEMAGFKSIVHCAASHGEGEITGPHSASAEYKFTGCVTENGPSTKCESKGANEKEITTGQIGAELVWIDQARHEAAILLNPAGGQYMVFECGGEAAEGRGSFLAPVTPLNTKASSFTATLSETGGVQTPDEYETGNGEKLQAIPLGMRGTHELVTTGVEATFTVHTSVPIELKAITGQEIEAKQREEALQKREEALKKQEEAFKKHEEEVNAQIAAALKKLQEAEAALKKKEEREKPKSRPPTRGRLLARALHECKKQPKRRRARCVAEAHRKYGPNAGKKGQHKGVSSGTLGLKGEPALRRLAY